MNSPPRTPLPLLAKQRWEILGPAAVALALTSLVVLLPYPPWEGYDWVQMQVFYKEYYREALLAGRLPLWDPLIGLGRPFLADVETATLYPPNLLYLAGVKIGLMGTLLLHFFLVIWGGRRVARQLGCREITAWFGAIGFALGAPLLGRLQSGQIQVFCALCWLPMTFAASRSLLDQPNRRNAVSLALTLTLLFLAGSPPIFWIIGWGASFWTIMGYVARVNSQRFFRSMIWFVAALLLAAGLASLQALPFLELISQGNRTGLAPDFALQHPQESGSWWSLLQSKPEGKFFSWEFNLFAGLSLAMLAGLAVGFWRRPEIRPLLLLALFFSLLAAGSAGAILPWLVEYVPGWNSFRFPSRYAIVTGFALSMLAGLTLEYGLRSVAAKKPRWIRAALWVVAFVLVINVVDCVAALAERSSAYARPANNLRERPLTEDLLARGLLRPALAPPRVIAPPWLVRENSGLRFGYSTVSSFANPGLARVWESLHAVIGTKPAVFDRVNLPLAIYHAPPGTLNGYGVVARWDPPSDEFRFDPMGDDPRAYLVTQSHQVADWREATHLLTQGHPFRQIALLEKPAGFTPAPLQIERTAHPLPTVITDFMAEKIVVNYSAATPALLVLAEPWYPGWDSKIDGNDAEVIPANTWMRAVAVPVGQHQVEFHYHSRWLVLGTIISVCAVGIASLLWFRQ